mmetsp:Transcript_28202/g.90377  ORF Transcript_28202/g.90377 Transcript_28202/m.90377 type:complete len:386 (+) Transcript_28202:41-1198(+)
MESTNHLGQNYNNTTPRAPTQSTAGGYWSEVEKARINRLKQKARVNPDRSRWLNMKWPALKVPNVTAAVSAALARPSYCVPRGGVMLSMANQHHHNLRKLQFARMANESCFMDRVVSICYGMTRQPDGLGSCVYGPSVPPSDFKRSHYVALNWAKWPLFTDALLVARVVLWLEADVLILQNPWYHLPESWTGRGARRARLGAPSSPIAEAGAPAAAGRRRTLGRRPPLLAIRYQQESYPCDPSLRESGALTPQSQSARCEVHPEPLNCGQLVVSSIGLARSVHAYKPEMLTNGQWTQQHYANLVIANRSDAFPSAPLPVDFASHCYLSKKAAFRARVAEYCKLVTYHACCVSTAKEKLHLMRTVLARTDGCAAARAAELAPFAAR